MFRATEGESMSDRFERNGAPKNWRALPPSSPPSRRVRYERWPRYSTPTPSGSGAWPLWPFSRWHKTYADTVT